MKTQSKKQIAYEALFDEAAVFEDEDVWEILEKKAEESWERYVTAYCEREAQEYRERVGLYFYGMLGGECRAHDRYGCPECSSYARGECPSYREERGWHDDSWPCW